MLRYHNIICVSDPQRGRPRWGSKSLKTSILAHSNATERTCNTCITVYSRLPIVPAHSRRADAFLEVRVPLDGDVERWQWPSCPAPVPELGRSQIASASEFVLNRGAHVYSPAVGRLFAGSGEPWGGPPPGWLAYHFVPGQFAKRKLVAVCNTLDPNREYHADRP